MKGTAKKSDLTVIRVVSGEWGPRAKEWFVKATLVKSWDNELNPGERVAWNGTLALYRDRKGKHYLERHDGNSNHRVYSVEVPASVANLSAEDALEWCA